MATPKPEEDYMARLFREATAGGDIEAMTHKQPSAGNRNSTGNAWANKPGQPQPSSQALMGNGKDFFAELRKQVASLVDKERVGG